MTSALLEDLVERGLDPGRRRLFVIDGSKALRKAIEKVFGQRHPIQRCRNHKLRNVLGHLPKDQHPQVKAAFRAAMKLDAKQGEQKLEQLARWLERDHPSASASLREGLSEMFTINRLGLPPRLRKCLGSNGNPISVGYGDQSYLLHPWAGTLSAARPSKAIRRARQCPTGDPLRSARVDWNPVPKKGYKEGMIATLVVLSICVTIS